MECAGIGSFVLLGPDVWAIMSVIGSTTTTGSIVIWTLLVLLLPIAGFLVRFFCGPRAAAACI
nr:PLDc N-terminal domain-containing protein [uncultured Roseobacter sp.]